MLGDKRRRRAVGAFAVVAASATLLACEGLIGADFDRALRDAGNAMNGDATDGDGDATSGDGGADAKDAKAKDALADARGEVSPQCGDMGGLDPDAPWPMTGYCPGRPSRSPWLSVTQPQVRRRVTIAPTVPGAMFSNFASSAAIDGAGTAYVVLNEFAEGSLRNYVVAIGTSKELWRTDVTGGLPYIIAEAATPVLTKTGEVVCASANTLFALTRDAGLVSWSRELGAGITGAPLVLGDGTVVVPTGNAVRAFTKTGADAWTFAIDGGNLFRGAVTATASGALLAVQSAPLGSVDAILHSFSPPGTLNWSRQLSGVPSSVPTLDETGRIVVRSSVAISVFAGSGTPLTTKAVSGGTATNIFPAVVPSGVWFGDGKAPLFLDTANDNTMELPGGGRRSSPVATASGDVIIALVQSPDARVVSLATDGSEQWSVPIDLSPETLQSPAIGKNGEVFVPFGNTLYVIAP